jgi:hypothetical protein
VFGVIEVRAGVPAVIEKPFVRDAVSPPVVTVTVVLPIVAVEEIVIFAVALVAPFTLKLLTIIPGPKLTVEVPCTKCVYRPVSATDAMVCPCWPLFGVTAVSAGAPPDTTMFTRVPPATLVPDVGFWLMTLPDGTVKLEAVETLTVKSSLVSALLAAD